MKFLSLSRYIISQATSVDWNLQPKPESELISLINQSVSVFNSMDVDSQPEPIRKLISLASSRFPSPNSRDSWKQNRDILDFFKDKKVEFTAKNVSEFLDKKIFLMIAEILSLETEPKLISLIHRIFSLVMSMNSTSKTFISLCPQVQVIQKEGKFHVIEQGLWTRNQKWDDPVSDDDSTEARVVSWRKNKWDCLPFNWDKFMLTEEKDDTHFVCRGCFGENHEDNSKAPVEIKHPLHPKHSLQLALFNDDKTRQCYCCDEALRDDTASMFYFCSPCDFGLKFTCAKKSPVLSIDQPKWHKHTLALFPSLDPQICFSIYVPLATLSSIKAVSAYLMSYGFLATSILSFLPILSQKEIGFVVFAAGRLTMITGGIIASRKVVFMRFIQNVPLNQMFGMV